jgi:hypothetical protein
MAHAWGGGHANFAKQDFSNGLSLSRIVCWSSQKMVTQMFLMKHGDPLSILRVEEDEPAVT